MDFPKELLILAFDHRGSFKKKYLGAAGEELTPEQLEQAKELKRMVYDGFELAVKEGVPIQKAGLLVDEEMGSAIIADAKRKGYTLICPAEKSGQDEFAFEYADWQEHIKNANPTFCKVLIRHNPDGDREANKRQAATLGQLGAFLKSISKGFLIEPLVPPTQAHLASVGGDKAKYDLEIRPKLMVRMIRELQEWGVEPDVWKLEGVDRKEDAEALVGQAHANGRKAGIVTLGRGESKEKVAEWLKVGAHINGVIGFAIGRTIFNEALEGFVAKKLTREQAVMKIAGTYKEFVELWQREKQGSG